MKKLLLALFLCSSATMAQECRYDGSQIEMNACAKRDYLVADKALNQAYFSKVRKLKTVKEKNALLAEQRAWLQRRDARCKLKPSEGSNATIDQFTCLQSMTEIRTLLLR